MMSDSRPTLVILSTGKEDGGRKASIGFSLAATSVSMGVDTSIFLTAGGTVWAQPSQTQEVLLEGFESLDTYIRAFIEDGGRFMICSPCMRFYCGVKDVSSAGSSAVYEKSEFAGIATVADMISTHSVVNF